MPVVAGVMPARNEEAFLPKTLEALANQSRHLDSFVLVDDGSMNGTVSVARGWAWRVAPLWKVVSVPDTFHPSKNSSRIAEMINAGIAVSRRMVEPDFYFICGADDVLDPNYVQFLVERMQDDPMLVIASGTVEGMNLRTDVPGGIRLIRAAWWDPPSYRPEYGAGWETYPILKAWHEGYRTRLFPEVVDHSQRPVGLRADWRGRGRAYRMLGYTWAEAGYRTFNVSFRQGYGARKGMAVLRGYVFGPRPHESWLKEVHRGIVKRRVTAALGIRRLRPMEKVVRALEKRGLDLGELDALEVFAGDGSLHVGDYASKVKSLEAWEVNPVLAARFGKNFPRASVMQLDSYEALEARRAVGRKYGLVVVDNSPTAMRGHQEHFELFPGIFGLIWTPGVLVLNVIPTASKQDIEGHPGLFDAEHLRVRARFYGTDHPGNIRLPELLESYRQKSAGAGRPVAWSFFQKRTYVYYLVLGYA